MVACCSRISHFVFSGVRCKLSCGYFRNFLTSELHFLFLQATQADFEISSLFIISPRLFIRGVKCNTVSVFSFKIKILFLKEKEFLNLYIARVFSDVKNKSLFPYIRPGFYRPSLCDQIFKIIPFLGLSWNSVEGSLARVLTSS